MTTTPLRKAIVRSGLGVNPDTIARYLPSNYEVIGTNADGSVVIAGHDSAGWTLDDYVIPRLASGLYTAKEVPA